MGGSGLLRERDLRAITAVVEDGLRDEPGEAMPWAVLDQLLKVVPCEQVNFNEYDLREHRPVTLQSVDEGGERSIVCSFEGKQEPPYPEYWTHRQQFRPYSYIEDGGGDLASVLRWSDFYTDFQLKNAPFYAAFLRPMDDRHGMYIPLPSMPGKVRRVLLIRKSEPDFRDSDLLVLGLLRPHLHEVFLDAERRRHGIPHLSRRELEVLRLASRGYSNADIARILFISPATVAKHMEHIFDRTGVRTRSAAAALALPSPLGFRPLHGK